MRLEVRAAMIARSPTRAMCGWVTVGATAIALSLVASSSAGAAEPIKVGGVLPFSGGVELNMFLARSEGEALVPVRALGEIAPESGCAPSAFAR